ncbi:MAG: hypothetical protein AAGD92_01085 [Pseudomonadota bacterium]
MQTTTGSFSQRLGLSALQLWIGAACIIACIGAAIFPPGAFSIDEAIYIDMAEAMAERGALDITTPNQPEGAPVLVKSPDFVKVVDARAVPQYPSLYAFIAVPFFLAFGINGLVLLNALAGIGCAAMTGAVASRLGADHLTVRWSIILFAAASIFASYVFAIWPHSLALVFVLGGALLCLTAAGARTQAPRQTAFLAGLIFGLGVGVRIDVIVSAAAAFFWLRLFARPNDRVTALALLAGLLPALSLIAFINQAKFGVFNPFTYGPSSGGGVDISSYKTAGAALVAVLAIALMIDTSSPGARRLIARTLRVRAPILVASIAGILCAVWFAFPKLPYGLYLLLVDMQAYSGGPRPGLERTPFGYWDFWGLPKKALLQSMAYLPLAVFPLVAFFKGRNVTPTAFLLLFAAAPIVFFAHKAWHGGMSYNMRYYLSATPFLTILAAEGLRRFQPIIAAQKSLLLKAIGAGVFLALVCYALIGDSAPALQTPFQLYPQLTLAFIILCAACRLLMGRNSSRMETLTAAVALAAIGYSVVLSVFDLGGYVTRRAIHTSYATAYAEMTKPGDLIFTQYDELLTSASLNGAIVARADGPTQNENMRAIAMYHSEGRCVYAHTQAATALFPENAFILLENAAYAERPDLGLFVHRQSPADCSP